MKIKCILWKLTVIISLHLSTSNNINLYVNGFKVPLDDIGSESNAAQNFTTDVKCVIEFKKVQS